MPAPSLFADPAAPAEPAALPTAAAREASCLLDLLYDGCYMVFLLRDGHVPSHGDAFREGLKRFLGAFERGSKRLGASAEDVHEAKLAFCALIDEVVLTSSLPLRVAWGRKPLQLELFGEQLAGERFFDTLERLRALGAAKLQVLEVFHMCLLLGFQGRYILEGSEKLGYLTSRVGEELANLKGRRALFAPHAAAPDRVAHAWRRDVPLWAIGSAFALAGLLAYAGLRVALDRQTQAELAGYTQVVRLAPQAAYFSITLP